MTAGILFSGIVAGLLAAVWAMFAGLPLLMILLFYAMAGFIGAVAFTGFVLLQPDNAEDRAFSRQSKPFPDDRARTPTR